MKLFSPIRCALMISVALLAGVGCDLAEPNESYQVIAHEGPPIELEDIDGEWSVDLDGQDITLLQGYPQRPGNIPTLRITLRGVNDGLPELVDVWYGPQDGGLGKRVRRATVEIEHWSLELMSGAIRAELPNGAKTNEQFRIDSDM